MSFNILLDHAVKNVNLIIIWNDFILDFKIHF